MMKKDICEQCAEQAVTAEVPAKQADPKKALLRTYFTSLLCLVLCVVMFFGTTFAWFTSSVHNNENEIFVGILKVGLEKEFFNKEHQEIELQDLVDPTKTYKLFDQGFRWEPGYTALETIRIVNEGDLAFKYVLDFADGTMDGDNTLSLADVAKYFEVRVYRHSDDTVINPGSYKAIVEDQNWTLVGSLADVLESDKIVLSGNMEKVRQNNLPAANANPGTTDGVDTYDRYTIALHMMEDADASVMGRKISLNVKLVAYQLSSEKDAFENSQYDDNMAAVVEAKELKDALAGQKSVVLATDITLDNSDECVNMATEWLDGNGKTITYTGEKVDGHATGVLNVSGGKITNLTVNGNENGKALFVSELTSALVVSNCTFDGAYAFDLTSAIKNDDALISFIDTRFISRTSYDNVANHVYFTGCTFDDVLQPYGDTTLTNCQFSTAGLDASKLEAGETIKLINCTYNGKLIEMAVLEAVEQTVSGEKVVKITISESDLIKVNADKLVVLKTNG